RNFFLGGALAKVRRDGRMPMRVEANEPAQTKGYKESYMSLAREIAPHLPLLRRYARALTGAQESGDAFVAATLEPIVAAPEDFPREPGTRVGLYLMFHRIWSSANIEIDGDEESSHGARKAQERLRTLSPLSRQALLLTTLESFTAQE